MQEDAKPLSPRRETEGAGGARRPRGIKGAVYAAIFAVQLVLAYPMFHTSLAQINPWDEAVYMNAGRELSAGKLPVLSLYPAVASVYAISYLLVRSSTFWMVAAWPITRIFFFCLLWWSGFLVARRLSRLAPPLVFVGLLFALPVLPGLLENASYSMFAAMSAFALWQFLGFCEERRKRHLALASLFLAFGALSRNEGLILFCCFAALALVPAFGVPRWRRAVAAVIPFAVVLGAYVATHRIATGQWALSTKLQSYVAFEQGHGLAFAGDYGARSAFVEGQLDARSLFGTPEENGNSVFRAIARNPRAYFSRIPRLFDAVWRGVFDRYGRGLGAICFLFAIRGVFELLRGRRFLLFATFLLWGGYSMLYVTLVFQSAALLMPYPLVLGLAAIGIAATVENFDRRREQIGWLVGAALLGSVIAAVTRNTEVPIVVAVLLLTGLVVWLVRREWRHEPSAAFAYLALFSALLMIKADHPFRNLDVAATGEEKSCLFIKARFPAESFVGTYSPGVVWNANMNPVTMERDLRGMKTDAELLAWMKREKIRGFYIDPAFRRYEPEVLALVERQVGHGLQVGFSTADHGYSVLLTTPQG